MFNYRFYKRPICLENPTILRPWWHGTTTQLAKLICFVRSFFSLFFSILFDFRYFSKRLELRIPDLFSFVTSATSRMLSFSVSSSVFFLGNLARRWSTRWFNYQDWYILLLLFIPVHIYIHTTIKKNYTDMIDNKTWSPPKQTFPRLFLPMALPREAMTRLSNSTESRSLPNAGPTN